MVSVIQCAGGHGLQSHMNELRAAATWGLNTDLCVPKRNSIASSPSHVLGESNIQQYILSKTKELGQHLVDQAPWERALGPWILSELQCEIHAQALSPVKTIMLLACPEAQHNCCHVQGAGDWRVKYCHASGVDKNKEVWQWWKSQAWVLRLSVYVRWWAGLSPEGCNHSFRLCFLPSLEELCTGPSFIPPLLTSLLSL